jgi:hypothetical protein
LLVIRAPRGIFCRLSMCPDSAQTVNFLLKQGFGEINLFWHGACIFQKHG